MIYRDAFAYINLNNLKHNLGLICQGKEEGQFICPMIKANAYGHGDLIIAKALEEYGVKNLGICLVEEAVALREGGIQCDILLFGDHDKKYVKVLEEKKITPVVSSWRQLKELQMTIKKNIKIHLKFDTGMNRLGFSSHDATLLKEFFLHEKKIQVVGVLSHLLNGEDADQRGGRTEQQIKIFEKTIKLFSKLPLLAHLYNSAGIAHKINAHSESQVKLPNFGFRPGLMLYGYNSVKKLPIPLKPVMSLRSAVRVIKKIKKGETVSYNGTWRAKKNSSLIVVPFGYADGYQRQLSNQSHVLFMKSKIPIIGNICMDYLMIDVTSLLQHYSEERILENTVTLLGEDDEGQCISADDLAIKANTIPWHILTSISQRIPRITSLGGT